MAFPSNTTVLEDFTRSPGSPPQPPGANWSLGHSYAGTALFLCLNGQCEPGGDYVVSYYNVSTYGPDSEVWLTVPVRTANAGDGPYICLRMVQPGTGTLDCYHLAVDTAGTAWKIYKMVNGVSTQNGATVNGGLTNGDKIGFEALGTSTTTLTAYRKDGTNAWSQIMQRTDSSSPLTGAGYIGLYIGNDESTTRLDDFGGGNATPPSMSLPMPNMARRMAHLLVR